VTDQIKRPGRQRRLDGFLAGGGEMGLAIRAHDWAATPLGPVAAWPQSLRSAVSILLPSKAQIVLFWGPELVAIYNDAYAPVFGSKHPWALGRPARDCWSEVWHVLGPLFDGVVRTGEAFWAKEHGGLTPAAALTAYASTSDRMKVLDAGFQIHITKPVQPAELATVVASLARRVGSGSSDG
jgi:hypothetical protein